jgi:hypothetical protein
MLSEFAKELLAPAVKFNGWTSNLQVPTGSRSMKILTVATFLIPFALAACDSEPASEAPFDAGNGLAGPLGPPPPDADLNASLEEVSGLEPRPRYVGRWAVGESFCRDTTWRFTERELTTPAGSACRFIDIREVPGGYDIAARCTAEAPEQDDRIRLRFPESAGGMLFESDVIADAGLVRCPEPSDDPGEKAEDDRGAR